MKINKPKRIPVTNTFRHPANYSREALCSLLSQQNQSLEQILFTDDVNKQLDILTNTFTTCLDTCAPLVTKKVKRPHALWFNDEVKQAAANKNSIQTQLKADRYKAVLQHRYKAENNYVKALIRHSKTEHYHNQFNACKGNTAATWKGIRDIVPGKNEKSINHNFENKEEKAEKLNNFFANVGKNTFEKTQHNLHN